MSFRDTANVALFSVSVTGRTITPIGGIHIGDIRVRHPAATGAPVTLTGGTDGATQYLYAQAKGGDEYTLVASTDSNYAQGRPNLVPVGSAVDYPSVSAASWVPLAGGALDPWVNVAADGTNVRLGCANAIAQQMKVDRFGRLNSTSSGATTFVLGTGAGTGVTNNCVGTDQWGVISFICGTSPVAPGILATVTFARPFTRAPYGVLSQWFGQGSLDSFVNRSDVTTTGFILRGATNLSAGSPYEYMYMVLGGD